MKKTLILPVMLLSACKAAACPFCNKDVMNGIYNSAFYPNLAVMLAAFIVLTVIVLILIVVTTARHKKRIAAYPNLQFLSPVPLTTASIVLGIGLGGFIDGILLHQILQVHEMLSNKIPATDYVGKNVNMFWDGIFHFYCLIVVIIGVVLLWKLLKRKDISHSGTLLAGGLLSGWAIFNIVEGIIDHQLLKLHNVIERSPDHAVGNYGFLGVSLLMLITGYLLINNSRNHVKAGKD
jgi:uncharacterized membrane protein